MSDEPFQWPDDDDMHRLVELWRLQAKGDDYRKAGLGYVDIPASMLAPIMRETARQLGQLLLQEPEPELAAGLAVMTSLLDKLAEDVDEGSFFVSIQPATRKTFWSMPIQEVDDEGCCTLCGHEVDEVDDDDE